MGAPTCLASRGHLDHRARTLFREQRASSTGTDRAQVGRGGERGHNRGDIVGYGNRGGRKFLNIKSQPRCEHVWGWL
eukprot:2625943-Prymnesium_polylepis.1